MMKKLVILFAVFTLVGSFALSAIAADWSFYGSARMKTFHEIDDKITTQTDPDDGDTTWDLQGNARLGATVKNGDVGGCFEYGSTPNLRKLYGTYTFGNNEWLVGQTYTPGSHYFYSNQVWGDDNDLLGLGQAYAGRLPMIQLTFNKMVKVALVRPSSTITVAGTDFDGDGTVETSENPDTDVMLPKLEVSFNMAKEKFFVDVFMGAQTFGVENLGTAGEDDVDVTSYVVGAGGGVTLGKAYVNAGISYALNGGNYGLASTGSNNRGTYNATAVDINDNTTLSGLLVAGLKPNEKVTVEVGVGYDTQDLDGAAEKDDTMCYYVNTTYTFTQGVFIVPEVGYFDYMDSNSGADQGSMLYFGAKTQINF